MKTPGSVSFASFHSLPERQSGAGRGRGAGRGSGGLGLYCCSQVTPWGEDNQGQLRAPLSQQLLLSIF